MHKTRETSTTKSTTNKKKIQTYVIVGSGDPPILLQVNSCFLFSVAIEIAPGATSGGWGGVNTVKL